MIEAGAAVPAARVWPGPRAAAVQLREALDGDHDALVCFYPFDWSPGCTAELRVLQERADDLRAAGIVVVGISCDRPWSQRAFGEALGLRDVLLLSDALGEAAAAFGVLGAADGIPRAERSAFLVRHGTVVASWELGQEPPDVDAVIAAASSS